MDKNGGVESRDHSWLLLITIPSSNSDFIISVFRYCMKYSLAIFPCFRGRGIFDTDDERFEFNLVSCGDFAVDENPTCNSAEFTDIELVC